MQSSYSMKGVPWDQNYHEIWKQTSKPFGIIEAIVEQLGTSRLVTLADGCTVSCCSANNSADSHEKLSGF